MPLLLLTFGELPVGYLVHPLNMRTSPCSLKFRAILHDENLYPDPFEFRPERFLKDGYISFEQQPDPILTGAFGYGRR